jgi:hypothetical protein
MGLSKELQIGKAGEHLTCCDLILQGYNAFLADQGLPFDLLVEKDGKLLKMQVKTTQKLVTYKKSKNVYRYGMRRAKYGKSRAVEADSDYYAFVALDIMKVAYIPISELRTRTNKVKTTLDLKTRRIKYTGRVYSNGTIRAANNGRYFEDYKQFKG